MNQLFDLQGKTAVITGGSGALGSSMAAYLAEQGVKIAILDLREEPTQQTVANLQQHGATALGVVGSVLDQASLAAACQKVVSTFGGVDILINAAGGNMPGATIPEDKTIFDLSMDDFRKVTDLNLNGTVMPSLVFGQQMSQAGHGCIVNISSMAAQRTLTRVVGYSAAKAAVDNFTRWMATEMARKYGDKIRVNAIAPGFFIGEQNRRLLLNEDGSLTARGETIIRQTPMGRFGQADELNGTIHWLCSPAATFVTGVVVPIDGGFSAFSGV